MVHDKKLDPTLSPPFLFCDVIGDKSAIMSSRGTKLKSVGTQTETTKLKEATSAIVATQTPREATEQLQVGLRYISAGLVQSKPGSFDVTYKSFQIEKTFQKIE